MGAVLCAFCVANLGPSNARPVAAILGGYGVCLEADDEDGTGAHWNKAWEMLTMTERESIANADGYTFRNPSGRL